MTTREQALARLIQVVTKDYRHTWYDRTVYLADLYRKLATGDGLDDLLQQYVKREDDTAFSQRKQLTQHITTSVVHNLMDVFYKVPRANYRRVLEHESDDAVAGDMSERTAALEDRLDVFWGIRSLDNYVQTRWLEINKTDPNAFIVVEFAPFDARYQRASPYPFEVYSKQAVDYEYQNNVLQHLIAETEIALPTKSNSKGKGKKYTVYLENESFTLTQIPNDTPGIPYTQKDTFAFVDGGGYFRHADKVFVLTFYPPHNAGRVPAKQAGYLRDGWTNGQTYVSPYEAAVPYLLKSVKVNSELDITMTQQVFPHRLQYAPKCQAQDCVSGYTKNGAACSSCHGTGIASISSAQDVIYVKMPKDGDDLLDLEKMLVFKAPAVEVVQFQKDYVEYLTDECKTAVFNSDIFTRSEVADTATGKTLDLQNVYDTLYTCSLGYAETWRFLVEMTADFTGLESGLRAELLFSKDFKLKGIAELLADLEAANRAQAGAAVTGAIQEDIMRIMFAENPAAFKEWEVKRAFDPFAGLSSEQINMALTNTNVPARLKMKYLLLSAVFSELEQEAMEAGVNFYDLAPRVQRERVEEKIKAFMDEAGAAAVPSMLPPTNGLMQLVEN